MKKRILFLCLLSVTVLLLVQCRKKSDDGYRFQFRFITEDYKPYNYLDNGKLTGLGPEVLRIVCNNLDIPFEVSVLPWDQGYDQALQNSNAVLFCTVLNPTRKDLFKWAGPIASLDWSFYSSSLRQFPLTSLDDAKLIGRIGVLPGYGITQYLESQGFTNLVYCADNTDVFQKLLNGEVDLVPSDANATAATLEMLGQTIYAVTRELVLRTDLVYFAFNKGVPDDVVADLQKEIDKIKQNGTLRLLYQKFLNSSEAPDVMQIYTEQYPPLTFMTTYGEVSGFGTDLVNEILRRNGLYYDIRLSSWSNDYEMALINLNFCLFTMDRTPVRDTLFQWVGPIGTNTTWFYTKTGSGVTIHSIEDAMNLPSVGTVSSWFSDQYLRQLGFTNLVSGPDPYIMAEKLLLGEITAFVCSDVTFPDIVKKIGYSYSDVIPSFALMSSDYYISFSKTTSASTVSQWQSTFDAIRLDGTYDAIHKKWFP